MRALLWVFLVTGAAAVSSSAEAAAPPSSVGEEALVDAKRPCRNMASFRAWLLVHAGHERNALQQWNPQRPGADTALQVHLADIAQRWLAECGAEEIKQLTEALVALRTVNTATVGKDVQAMAEAGEYLRKWATQANLNYSNIDDNSAYEISLGTGDVRQVWLSHLDVVAAGEGWKTDPFKLEVQKDVLVGRGVEDAKGPVAGALVALKAMALVGLQPKGAIAVTVSTDGERGGAGLTNYAEHTKQAQAAIGFDTVFPLGVAEPGIGLWRLSAPIMGASSKPLRPVAISAVSGNLQHPEAGSGNAAMTLKPGPAQTVDALAAQAQQAATQVLAATRGADETLRADIHPDKAGAVVVSVHGRPVYDPAQDSNSNVIWVLGQIAQKLQVAPNGVGALLQVIDGFLANRPTPLERLYMVPTALGTHGDRCELQLYLRRPYGSDETAIRGMLSNALKRMQAINPYIVETAPAQVGEGWMSHAKPEVVATLSKVYQKHIGEVPRSEPLPNDSAVRFYPQGIGFGPRFTNQPRTAHGPNESVSLSDLHRFATMVCHAMLMMEFGYDG